MTFNLIQANTTEIQKAFGLLQSASKTLEKKNIKQWNYWQNPPLEKVKWVEEGFENNEFYFIENEANELMGMVRIMDEDVNYWGVMNDKAKYIHSLVIDQKFSGNHLGTEVVKKVATDAKNDDCDYLRLDCDASNRELCSYYEKQGFIKVGQKQLPLGVYNLYQKQLTY